MASGTRRQLEQAYNLIQQDDLDGALTILRPIVSVQPDNAEAWWLIANAVSEPVEAYEALDNVVRLNPQNQEAKEQLDNLLVQFPNVASEAVPPPAFDATDSGDSFSVDELLASSAAGSSASAPAPENYDSMFGNEAAGDDSALDLDSFFGSGSGAKPATTDAGEDAALDAFFTSGTAPSKPVEKQEKKRGWGRGKAPKEEEGFVEPPTMDDEQAAQKPAKEEKKPRPQKIQAPKEQPVLDPLEAERRANRRPNRSVIYLLLASIIVLAGGAFLVFVLPNLGKAPAIPAPVAAAMTSVETVLKVNDFNGVKADLVGGDTLQATICDKAGPTLQDTVVKAMDLVAREAAAIKDSIKAAAVVVVNCNKTDVIILHEVAPIDAVVAYVTGNMANKRDFRASWIKK